MDLGLKRNGKTIAMDRVKYINSLRTMIMGPQYTSTKKYKKLLELTL